MSGRTTEDIGSAYTYAVAWTTTPATYNIRSSDPELGKKTGNNEGRACRALITGKAGTLVVTRPDGTAVTLPSVSDGYRWDVQGVSLANTSTAQDVVVVW